MLNEFLRWWADQLRAALPARLAAAGPDSRGLLAMLHLPPEGPASVELRARHKGRDGRLGPFTLDGPGSPALRAAAAGHRHGVVLELPPGLMLEQQVVLPIAAERDPERVLAYEMDRITPFSAEELFWTWAVDRRDRAQGRLHLRLSVVPKARLLPSLDALVAAGLRPTALDAARPDGTRCRIALDHTPPARWQAWSVRVAGAFCAVLVVGALVTPFLVQSAARERVERQIAALRPQVEQAEALRRRILGSTAGSDVFAEQRARVGDALGTIATLTDVLPDDTHLTELTMRARVLTLAGQSAAAARLIAAMAAEPGLRNPAFSAPVTRFEGVAGEGFAIRAEAAP